MNKVPLKFKYKNSPAIEENGRDKASGAVPAQDVMIAIPLNFARYIKVTQTRSASNSWSIAEFNLYH
ncbi:hypothetical protein [Paenibacillus sp. LjRoot56]|uniref:hypothetical protein n=1 Tax=Paenibacillus sp. LjRoot56 TaxID=3342333 RepID=UPI003ECC580E